MNRKKAAWTTERRLAHSKLMKQIWEKKHRASGKLPPPKNWLQRIWDVMRGAH